MRWDSPSCTHMEGIAREKIFLTCTKLPVHLPLYFIDGQELALYHT